MNENEIERLKEKVRVLWELHVGPYKDWDKKHKDIINKHKGENV